MTTMDETRGIGWTVCSDEEFARQQARERRATRRYRPEWAPSHD